MLLKGSCPAAGKLVAFLGLAARSRPAIFYSETSGFPRLIAVRYLGGILEMPTFWVYDRERYPLHSVVAQKLIRGTMQLIEDLITASSDVIEIDQNAECDTEGIDLLAESTLVGVEGWIRKKVTDNVQSECWFDNFMKLIKLLQRHVLPPSCHRFIHISFHQMQSKCAGRVPQILAPCC